MTTAQSYRLFIVVLAASELGRGQTTCAIEHQEAGVFICYPTSLQSDAPIPRLFHLSAQVNAEEGHRIVHYTIRVDETVVSDIRVAVPVQRLSIETNVMSPFDSGEHTLQVAVTGVGSAKLEGLRLSESQYNSICDPFRRFDPRLCPLSVSTGLLNWAPGEKAMTSLAEFPPYLGVFGRNLKSIEADIADAIFVDGHGKVFAAMHSSANIELRRYEPNGSISYDTVIRSCGDGFLSLTGIDVDDAGRAWIVGNTTGCIRTTGIPQKPTAANSMRGFVMLLDTTKIGPSEPVYSSYLSDVPCRAAALRLDREGNLYVIGTTESHEFPHDSELPFPGIVGENREYGFVTALAPTGSRLWSTLLPNTKLTSLALHSPMEIFVTGRAPFSTCETGRCDHVLVAAVADHGARLSYLAHFGGSREDEGRAVALDPSGNWLLVAGVSDSPDFLAPSTQGTGASAFAASVPLCGSGKASGQRIEAIENLAPESALPGGLDRFGAALSSWPKDGSAIRVTTNIGPRCPSPQ